MILRALLTALVLSGIYSAALKWVPASWPRSGVTLHQANIVRAEAVMYSDRVPDNLLVGTSLTERLEPKDLGPEFARLAFTAGSGVTGLEMVRRSALKPRRVFIESNLLYHTVDAEVIDYFYSLPLSWLREHLTALRQSNQPANLFYSWVKSWKKAKPEKFGPELLRIALNDHVRHGAALPEATITSVMDGLEKDVDYLRTSGIEVTFVQFPEHPEIAVMPLNLTFRAALRTRFPEAKYHWLYPDKSVHYETTDGMHLDVPSATVFAHELRKDAGL